MTTICRAEWLVVSPEKGPKLVGTTFYIHDFDAAFWDQIFKRAAAQTGRLIAKSFPDGELIMHPEDDDKG